MLAALREEAPDADDREWYPLSLRRLNQRLRDQEIDSNPETLRELLAGLARDGRGLAGNRASLEFRQIDRDHYRVRLHRDWRALEATALRRQAVATVILQALLAKVPADAPPSKDLLVSFGTDELSAALDQDITLANTLTDKLAALDRGLLFLHEHRAIVLQSGIAVFRQAMTIRVLPEAKGKRYNKGHYAPLETHYGERVFQIHVMNAYARLGLEKIRQAIGLVGAYFTLDKESFVRRYFPDQQEILERATTAESFRRIVDSLGNPRQTEIVAAAEDGNRLVLAGPGSGKTRVIVHRCAYLLRVRRVDPRAILILCYNRNAALELRRRLNALVGDDARGVTIQTYHGFAMRLSGRSFAERGEPAATGQTDFSRVIEDAVALLEGRVELPGIESDTLRERLLAGYRHILVDEYQDIDAAQYRMIAAIAGRRRADTGDTGKDPDQARLTLLAVGDDDQNIYAFRGADVAFIRRFREDYDAQPHHLVENYRSTRHIIAAANALIAHNRDRMKSDQAIRIDHRRTDDPPGGRWESLDAHGRGRVEILEVPDPARQAAALVDRLRRLHDLGGDDWAAFAVLAFRHETLHPIRALCEAAGIPVAWRQELPALARVREIAGFLDQLRTHARESMTADGLARVAADRRQPLANAAARPDRRLATGGGRTAPALRPDRRVLLRDPVGAAARAQRRGRGAALDPARRQGAGVPACADRRWRLGRRDQRRAGTAALLCRHDPRARNPDPWASTGRRKPGSRTVRGRLAAADHRPDRRAARRTHGAALPVTGPIGHRSRLRRTTAAGRSHS